MDGTITKVGVLIVDPADYNFAQRAIKVDIGFGCELKIFLEEDAARRLHPDTVGSAIGMTPLQYVRHHNFFCTIIAQNCELPQYEDIFYFHIRGETKILYLFKDS